MNRNVINRVFEDFCSLSVLVVGDVMIDAYYRGDTHRISPEAPVPVVNVTHKEERPGGAANVAMNLKSLGADVSLFTCVGEDDSGLAFKELIANEGIRVQGILPVPNRITTRKTRVICQQQHLLRIDEEDRRPFDQSVTKQLSEMIKETVSSGRIDLLIFEDYDKGLINSNLVDEVVEHCRQNNVLVTVDPKEVNFWSYKKVNLFKPNFKELNTGLKLNASTPNLPLLDEAFEKLQAEMQIEQAVITLSGSGVYWNDGSDSGIIPAHIRNISDVSGAGDTVISVLSACLAMGLDLKSAARLANLAGGLVCEESGVVPINKYRFKDEAINLVV